IFSPHGPVLSTCRVPPVGPVELSGFLGTKIHGLSTDVQYETLSQHRSITMTQFLT
ncbi:hypothetical protein N657DRAFT_650290, partial [Parathielavia appendiculata]